MAGSYRHAGIAQLVERNLAKVEVAGSNPVSRSNFIITFILFVDQLCCNQLAIIEYHSQKDYQT